jgi:hypothetical protein
VFGNHEASAHQIAEYFFDYLRHFRARLTGSNNGDATPDRDLLPGNDQRFVFDRNALSNTGVGVRRVQRCFPDELRRPPEFNKVASGK